MEASARAREGGVRIETKVKRSAGAERGVWRVAVTAVWLPEPNQTSLIEGSIVCQTYVESKCDSD
jgi:hypothetical protein